MPEECHFHRGDYSEVVFPVFSVFPENPDYPESPDIPAYKKGAPFGAPFLYAAQESLSLAQNHVYDNHGVGHID